MDRVIQNKWNGKYDITHSFLDGSIAYTLLQDQYGLYATDRVFSEIKIKMFNWD